MVLAGGVGEMSAKELAEVMGGGRIASPFSLNCFFFVAAYLVVRWTVVKCVVALVMGSTRVASTLPCRQC